MFLFVCLFLLWLYGILFKNRHKNWSWGKQIEFHCSLPFGQETQLFFHIKLLLQIRRKDLQIWGSASLVDDWDCFLFLEVCWITWTQVRCLCFLLHIYILGLIIFFSNVVRRTEWEHLERPLQRLLMIP